MLGPSASLVIIVYGERHSHAWAPSALFSFMIVVKLREAAFGSLGLKRLCSRTCLVLICCTQSSINILRTVHSLIRLKTSFDIYWVCFVGTVVELFNSERISL